VIRIIETDVLPTILRHALVGEARVLCQAPRHAVLARPLALDMMVDVMYDRGFSVCAEGKLKPPLFLIAYTSQGCE
jgi:hypothetical protein